jgi:hypothetical protein
MLLATQNDEEKLEKIEGEDSRVLKAGSRKKSPEG